jgi:hypothetical protein
MTTVARRGKPNSPQHFARRAQAARQVFYAALPHCIPFELHPKDKQLRRTI